MKNLALLTVLCSFLIAGCDLFSGPQTDLLSKINDEVAWANAEKLDVTIGYNGGWGTSNPPQGLISRNVIDIRKGEGEMYEFTVEFTPGSTDFYKWIAIGEPYEETMSYSDLMELEIKPPEVEISGGTTAKITINRSGPITLVPVCSDVPILVSTSPDFKESEYPIDMDFFFRFNVALDSATVVFGDNAVSIKIGEQDAQEDAREYFKNPIWDNGTRSIIIEPSYEKLPPVGATITVTFGSEIKSRVSSNPIDTDLSKTEFSWTTKEIDNTALNVSLNTWNTQYNNAGRTVTADWTYKPDGNTNPVARAYYRVNNGGRQELSPLEKGELEVTIPDITALDTGRVKEHGEIGTANRYDIYIEFVDDGRVFKTEGPITIWNIPGISNSKAVPVTEINTAAGLAGVSGSGKYVLANSIDITDTWTPIGTSAAPFTGEFYGNGYAVTISGMDSVADTGLFGVVSGASRIRDLTVIYDNGSDDGVSVNRTGALNFGGIAGNAGGNTQIENVMVKGKIVAEGTAALNAGGVVGLFENTTTKRASITNAYSSLDLTVYRENTTDSFCVGGIVGNVNGAVTVEEVSAVGNITAGSGAKRVVGPTSDASWGIVVGGVVGRMSGADSNRVKLQNADYRQGNISISAGFGDIHLGGAVGCMRDYADITFCSAVAGEISLDKSDNTDGYVFLGGFLGDTFNSGGGIINCYSDNHVKATATATSTNAELRVGGFIGNMSSDISYCYAKGDVSATQNNIVKAGGFAGEILFTGSSISNCYATGRVEAYKAETINAGGLVGLLEYVEQTSYGAGPQYCFASGSVTSRSNNSTATTNAGGLVGRIDKPGLQPYFTNYVQHCAATGASVTVTGGGSQNPGRVYGSDTSDCFVISNNYANSDMTVYQSTSYTGTLCPVSTTSADHNNLHGFSKTENALRTSYFWENPPNITIPGTSIPHTRPTYGTPSAYHGPGFDYTHWDYSAARIYGYPLLKDADGRVMGGQ